MTRPYLKTRHSASDLSYHLVFTVKYRKAILTGQLAICVKEERRRVCTRYGWPVLAVAVQPDHVHLLVLAPPTTLPVRIAATIKSIVTVEVFRRFGLLKARHFQRSGLFSRGTYYGAVGAADRATITEYIVRQA